MLRGLLSRAATGTARSKLIAALGTLLCIGHLPNRISAQAAKAYRIKDVHQVILKKKEGPRKLVADDELWLLSHKID